MCLHVCMHRPAESYGLKTYVPVASELLDWLHASAMPKTLPDGRTESPGVLRIYVASMVILAIFYTVSIMLGAVMQGLGALLRAAGILKGGCCATVSGVGVRGCASSVRDGCRAGQRPDARQVKA